MDTFSITGLVAAIAVIGVIGYIARGAVKRPTVADMLMRGYDDLFNAIRDERMHEAVFNKWLNDIGTHTIVYNDTERSDLMTMRNALVHAMESRDWSRNARSRFTQVFWRVTEADVRNLLAVRPSSGQR